MKYTIRIPYEKIKDYPFVKAEKYIKGVFLKEVKSTLLDSPLEWYSKSGKNKKVSLTVKLKNLTVNYIELDINSMSDNSTHSDPIHVSWFICSAIHWRDRSRGWALPGKKAQDEHGKTYYLNDEYVMIMGDGKKWNVTSQNSKYTYSGDPEIYKSPCSFF